MIGLLNSPITNCPMTNCPITNKGNFCLIGQSNLEFHWLIHWNLVNSFEAREDDCQLCDTSTIVFLFQVSCLFMRSWHGLNENCWLCEYLGYWLFYMEESFSPKRKSWGVIDNVQNVVSKKNYSVRRHETWETAHSKMSLPDIVFIINRVFNTGLNCFSIKEVDCSWKYVSFLALNDIFSAKRKRELIHRQGKIKN